MWSLKSSRGSGGLRTLLTCWKAATIAITPDGPRGPRRVAAPGGPSLRRCRACRCCRAPRRPQAWVLPTWDHMMESSAAAGGPCPYGTSRQLADAVPAIGVALTAAADRIGCAA
jgi:lysophospholipid acyltransferase (LPLAT)-like uncharacterized protein